MMSFQKLFKGYLLATMFLNSNPFSSDVHQTLCINNSVLNSQQSIKLLGVHIDRKLSFTEHVNIQGK